jgi:holo-[acyl-carrier protein] synthase
VIDMLIGTGVDLIEVARIAESIERFGPRFLERIFTGQEIAYCASKRNGAESFAARFAAKEAGAKALGTGITLGITWREIEVTRSPLGRPDLELSGRARALAQKLGVRTVTLAITHTAAMAIAMVMMET